MADDDLGALETAVALLHEVEAIFDRLNVGACATHLDACIATLEQRIAKARSGELPLVRRAA